jgi:pimeloyl-ACP methyl ester carboxylesterase
MEQLISGLSNDAPKLQPTVILPGCGHWTQQERPQDVNKAMIDFLRQL